MVNRIRLASKVGPANATAVELVDRKLWQDQTGLPLSRLADRVGYPGSPTDQHFASIHADGKQRIHSALLGNGDTQIAVQLPA